MKVLWSCPVLPDLSTLLEIFCPVLFVKTFFSRRTHANLLQTSLFWYFSQLQEQCQIFNSNIKYKETERLKSHKFNNFQYVIFRVFSVTTLSVVLNQNRDNFSINPDHNVLKVYKILMQTFFYKHHFYKQRQAEIGKKSSKCSATLLGWTFAIWKLFLLFIHVIIQI